MSGALFSNASSGFNGENRLDDRFVHDGNPSKIVSLPSPTTSRRAKPN